jgi:hypothetical protein
MGDAKRGAIMDGDRFDTMVRSLAASASRRGVIRALGAGALGGLAALLRIGTAGACRPAGVACLAYGRGCCSQVCCKGTCCDDTDVCTGSGCCERQNYCDHACTDVLSDPANCGSCGHACAPGAACVGGSCACHPAGHACTADSDCCGHDDGDAGRCIDGVCRCCNSGWAGCGSYTTDGVCCDVPQLMTLCCTDDVLQGGSCDDPSNFCVTICCDSRGEDGQGACLCPGGMSPKFWLGAQDYNCG